MVSADVDAFLQSLVDSKLFGDDAQSPQEVHPRTVERTHLTVTGRCNLRCAHCGAVRVLHAEDRLKFEDIKSIVDQLNSRDGASIAITGGEPLLRGDIVDIIHYAAERIKTILSSNGSLITDDLAAKFAGSRLTYQISLDGATADVHDAVRGKGSFAAALRGIELLQKHGAQDSVELCRTIMGRPNEDLEPFVELGQSLGVGGIRFLCLAQIGRADENYDSLNPSNENYRAFYREYYRMLADSSIDITLAGGVPGLFLDVPEGTMWCHVGEMLEVDPEGRIYPCSVLARPEFEIGTIWDMSLQEAAESDKMMSLMKIFSNRQEKIEICKACPFKNFCQAGCPGMTYAEKGTFFSEDNLCRLRRELFEDLFFDVLSGLPSPGQLKSENILI